MLEVLTHENTFERLKYLLMGSETMGHKKHLADFEVYENVQKQKKKEEKSFSMTHREVVGII